MTVSSSTHAAPTIVRLASEHQEAFLRFVADYETDEPSNMNFAFYRRGRDDFEGFLRRMDNEERGENLAPNLVPCSHRWLVTEEEIVGVVRIRHNIDMPFLQDVGGHIGYDVPPSHRRRGYGTVCLQAGLVRARELGIPRVLLTCSDSNIASQRIIEQGGGILDDERFVEAIDRRVRRYWIEINPQ